MPHESKFPLLEFGEFQVNKSELKYEELIGEGATGKVYRGILKKTKQQVAIKEILIENAMQRKNFIFEIQIGLSLRHPNAINFLGVSEIDSTRALIVMEYFDGSELYWMMKKIIVFSELEAFIIIRQVLRVLKYLEKLQIVHRDIKLENILINDEYVVKLIDFGLARNGNASNDMKSRCGTSYYMAPEVVREHDTYGSPCDVWSAGVVLFAISCGFFPFDDEKVSTISKLIRLGTIVYPPYISDELKDLLKSMLEPDQLMRITAAGALTHPWMLKMNKLLKKVEKGGSIPPKPEYEQLLDAHDKNQALQGDELSRLEGIPDLSQGTEEESSTEEKAWKALRLKQNLDVNVEELRKAKKSPARLNIQRTMTNEQSRNAAFTALEDDFQIYSPSMLKEVKGKELSERREQWAQVNILLHSAESMPCHDKIPRADPKFKATDEMCRKELLALSWKIVVADASTMGPQGRNRRRFHEDFELMFLRYCPDLVQKFPNNYKLISKMIQSFMSNAISKKDYSKMASTFAKGHKRYKLTSGHFEGFKEALLDTIKLRSGNLATIELVTAWKITIGAIVGALHKAYYSVLSRRRR
mmetsp:Transcript_28370/g.39460  ORF Transcript_28370/g.39460 Transcript_28370/m.39460 type:complete len:586 (+) Transcript_28370:140-1897(+)